MSRIVGEGFFPEDIFEYSTDAHSGVPYQDVCPERFSRLEKELVRGKGEIVSLSLPLARRDIYSCPVVQASQPPVNCIRPD
jgi:hypothetical protein